MKEGYDIGYEIIHRVFRTCPELETLPKRPQEKIFSRNSQHATCGKILLRMVDPFSISCRDLRPESLHLPRYCSRLTPAPVGRIGYHPPLKRFSKLDYSAQQLVSETWVASIPCSHRSIWLAITVSASM